MKPSSLLRFLKMAQRQAFQVAVIAVLASIGLWGHKTHWQFSAPHATAESVHVFGPGSPSDLIDVSSVVHEKSVTDKHKAARVTFAEPALVQELGVSCEPLTRRPIARELSAPGVVMYDPMRFAQLSARVSGTVWRVEKQVGEEIQAGDVLAIIDAPAVGQAKADFLHAIADVELREKAYERLQAFGNGEVPGKQIEEAETALRKARVDRFNAQQALISLGLPVKLEQWEDLPEAELQRRTKFLGLPESIVSQLDADTTTATLLPIIAPFSGVVTGHNVTKGEVVSPSENQFEIADVSQMWIVLDVRGRDADELQLGQKVAFRSGKSEVESTIKWLSTAVDARTRTVEVRCEVQNPAVLDAQGNPTGNRLLRANAFGVGVIRFRENPSALAVPSRAVQRDGQLPIVFVQIDDCTYEARQVELGTATPELTEIVSGLDGSERVVVNGSHALKAELLRSAGPKPP